VQDSRVRAWLFGAVVAGRDGIYTLERETTLMSVWESAGIVVVRLCRIERPEARLTAGPHVLQNHPPSSVPQELMHVLCFSLSPTVLPIDHHGPAQAPLSRDKFPAVRGLYPNQIGYRINCLTGWWRWCTQWSSDQIQVQTNGYGGAHVQENAREGAGWWWTGG
jgi:hypothetical protein